MKRVAIVVLVVVAVGAVAVWFSKSEYPTYGGDPESALVTATAASDVAKVRELLAAAASPNKMVRYDGLYHSAWEVALHNLRPRHPERVEIVKAMLKAGANLEFAWGSQMSRGIVRRFPQSPIHLAMVHPDADVMRAFMETRIDRRLGQNALVSAAETGEDEIVHILVEGGVDVNGHPGANTALVAAIEARNVALMTYLEEHGAREKP